MPSRWLPKPQSRLQNVRRKQKRRRSAIIKSGFLNSKKIEKIKFCSSDEEEEEDEIDDEQMRKEMDGFIVQEGEEEEEGEEAEEDKVWSQIKHKIKNLKFRRIQKNQTLSSWKT